MENYKIAYSFDIVWHGPKCESNTATEQDTAKEKKRANDRAIVCVRVCVYRYSHGFWKKHSIEWYEASDSQWQRRPEETFMKAHILIEICIDKDKTQQTMHELLCKRAEQPHQPLSNETLIEWKPKESTANERKKQIFMKNHNELYIYVPFV